MTDYERARIVELRNRGLGYRQISDLTGLKLNTVKTFFRRNQGTENAEGEVVCKHCGAKFFRTRQHKNRVFCSDKCRWAWWNSHRRPGKGAAFKQSACERCGSIFESYSSAKRKYCSVQCYREHQREGGNYGR